MGQSLLFVAPTDAREQRAQLGQLMLSVEHAGGHAIGAGAEQRPPFVLLFLVKSPAADDQLEFGVPRPETLAEMPRVSHSARRHRADDDDRWPLVLDALGHLGRQHGRADRIELGARRVEQLPEHREGDAIDLIACRAHQQGNRGAGGSLRSSGACLRRCVRTILCQVFEDLPCHLDDELRITFGDLVALPVLLVHPGNAARLRVIGRSAAIHGPT